MGKGFYLSLITHVHSMFGWNIFPPDLGEPEKSVT
jgi:hypothetical protein